MTLCNHQENQTSRDLRRQRSGVRLRSATSAAFRSKAIAQGRRKCECKENLLANENELSEVERIEYVPKQHYKWQTQTTADGGQISIGQDLLERLSPISTPILVSCNQAAYGPVVIGPTDKAFGSSG